jgi:hypothetical protein
MAYSGLIRRLLISCPSDLPMSDLAVVHKAINRWNGVYGHSFGAAIIPISWGTHAAAEFGGAPQELLNRQLVDGCDMCLALFANRLGTRTVLAESGTAEEIERIAETGRYVAVLRSRRQVDTSRIDLAQAQRLEKYLETLQVRALILDYATDDELSQKVDTILAAAVARDQGRAELQLQQEPAQVPQRIAEVWPRIDSSERTNYLGNGPTTTRNWYLVLANTGDAPARNVRVKLEPYSDGQRAWDILADNVESETEIEVLAPHTEVRFLVVATMGMSPQIRCIVSWSDERGEQENIATLRLA